MDTKYWILVAAIGVVGVVALLGLSRPEPVTKVVETIKEQLGAASSPAVVEGCMEISGGKLCTYGQKMTNASTTCSFKLPSTASTTLVAAAASITNSFGGGFGVEWGRGATAYATTTSLGYRPGAIASGDKGTFTASTTPLDMEDEDFVLAPGGYLNFKIGSTSPTIAGYCYAQVLNLQ